MPLAAATLIALFFTFANPFLGPVQTALGGH